MGFFTKKEEKARCKGGAICAWEYRGGLYKTKELRDKAERNHKRAEAIDKLSDYLGSYLEPYFKAYDGPRKYNDYPGSMRRRSITPHELAFKLVDGWPMIRDHIDAIVKANE